MTNHQSIESLALLDDAIDQQQARMRGYEIESEALTLETVRSLDYVYFKDLIPELSKQQVPTPQEISIMQWGVNEALRRVLPQSLGKSVSRVHVSNKTIQRQADNFIFESGVLTMAKRQRVLLSQQLLRGFIDPRCTKSGSRILVLDAENPSVYWDAIGRAGMAWLSNQIVQLDRASEIELEQRHMEVLPQLTKYLSLPHTWEVSEPFENSEKHFHDWANIYLRRMVYRDLLAEDDIIGGHSYGSYVATLTVISAMCQMRLCYAGILHSNRLRLDIRNTLTGATFLIDLCNRVAKFLDADTQEVTDLLEHLTLSPNNHKHHFDSGTPAWAPIIRTSESFCILPSYGLDINPFNFLMHELRTRYKDDWFRLANRREARWVKELAKLFPSPRWTCTSGTKLKRDGKVVTDIDFVAYDNQTRQLALFQLKWQQPALGDEKMRGSNGANLIETSNKWVQDVQAWLSEFGTHEFLRRAQLAGITIDQVALFVIARYSAHFPSKSAANINASWSDWGHLCMHREARPNGSVLDLESDLRSEMERKLSESKSESFVLPLPGLALIINPTKRPAF